MVEPTVYLDGIIICVDPLPNLPHYVPGQAGYSACHDLDALYKTIVDLIGPAKGGIDSYPWTFDNGIQYYYNTDAAAYIERFGLPDEGADLLLRGYEPEPCIIDLDWDSILAANDSCFSDDVMEDSRMFVLYVDSEEYSE